jgi:hypothetical protein
VEALFNGQFLAYGHELGMLGGVGEALVIALLNVGTGAFIGHLVVRQMFHVSFGHRFTSLTVILVYVVGLLAFNIAVAHYRDALGGAQPEEAGKLALNSLLTSPFEIKDIKSWVLTIMGFSFSLIACIDAFSMDDRYPKYGQLIRHRSRHLEEYRDIKEQLVEELQEIKNKVLQQLENLAKKIEQSKNVLKVITEGRLLFIEKFRQHLNYLDECGNRLLVVYREANTDARSTPPPNHFQCRWRSESTVDIDAIAGHTLGTIEIRDDDIDKTIETLTVSRLKLLAEWESNLRKYKKLDEL